MPKVKTGLLEIGSTEIHWRCLACESYYVTPIADLQLGVAQDAQQIALPVCLAPVIRQGINKPCQTANFLTRPWDAHPNGVGGGEHRKLVLRLAHQLKAKGQSHPSCKAQHDAEVADPPDLKHALGEALR